MNTWIQWTIGGTTTVCLGLIGLIADRKLGKDVFGEFKDAYTSDQKDQKQHNRDVKFSLDKISDKLDSKEERK